MYPYIDGDFRRNIRASRRRAFFPIFDKDVLFSDKMFRKKIKPFFSFFKAGISFSEVYLFSGGWAEPNVYRPLM